MEKITSFTINHLDLLPGIYVSRKDHAGSEVITTFDIRMTAPNREPVMNTAEVHTLEHLTATFLRNHPVFGDKVIYMGPMGCRTGFYLLLAGDYRSADIVASSIDSLRPCPPSYVIKPQVNDIRTLAYAYTLRFSKTFVWAYSSTF